MDTLGDALPVTPLPFCLDKNNACGFLLHLVKLAFCVHYWSYILDANNKKMHLTCVEVPTVGTQSRKKKAYGSHHTIEYFTTRSMLRQTRKLCWTSE